MGSTVVVELLEDHGGDRHPCQRVGEPPGQVFLSLERAAQGGHGEIGGESKMCRESSDALLTAADRAVEVTLAESISGDPVHQRTGAIGEDEAHMAPECPIEGDRIALLDRFQFRGDMGVTADRALTEDDHRPGQYVGPLDGDSDRYGRVGIGQYIARSATDGIPRDDVHAVIDDVAQSFGGECFCHRADDRRLLATIYCEGGRQAQRIEGVTAGC